MVPTVCIFKIAGCILFYQIADCLLPWIANRGRSQPAGDLGGEAEICKMNHWIGD